MEKYFWQEKDKLLQMEKKAQLLSDRVSVHKQILSSVK